MTSPAKLLPSIGLGFLASALLPEDQPASQTAAKPEAPPPAASPASAPSTTKPKRSSPTFLSGSSMLPPPGSATQGKTLLGT